jgi:hypothetical protein
MMRQIVSSALGLWLACGAASAESEQGVVVELYTSQGCSSCPPADELMGQLAEMPGVIGLALHVDYWDYIGWPDTFADPRYTERQKAYAQAAGDRMIYTPQMIVAGGQRVEGNQPGQVAAAIAQSSAAPRLVDLKLSQQGDQLAIHAESRAAVPSGTTVQLVRYKVKGEVAIDRGENAGLNMEYHNIVTSWQKIAEWSGSEPLDMTTEAAGEGPIVVIVQSAGPGAILAAAQLK